jgi:heptose I phosphotransferase
MKLFLSSVWQQRWAGRDPFAEAQALHGQVYRSKEGRRTLRFEAGGRGYFLKWHGGIGWGEIAKNLLQLRLPVLGAENEYRACLRLAELHIDTMTAVAFGRRGANPATQESFLITEELAETVSLEDVGKQWATQAPSIGEKRTLIRKLAQISKTLHDNGLNHRDYYLCHFLKSDNGQPFTAADPLYLIDLHRMQQRATLPCRWRTKDISGLFYSAFDLPLTRRDIICFLHIYQPAWLARPAPEDVKQIVHKAVALYRKDFGRAPPPAILTLLSKEGLI